MAATNNNNNNNIMVQPCLWFSDNDLKEVISFYTSLFPKNSGIVSSTNDLNAVEFQLEGLSIFAIGNRPQSIKSVPFFSFWVNCSSEAEIDEIWKKLFTSGEVRMGLAKYDWSEKYAWIADKYGVEWQLSLTKSKNTNSKIFPVYIFVNDYQGKGEEATNFYTDKTLFPNSVIENIHTDPTTQKFVRSVFSIGGQEIMLIDGGAGHPWSITPAATLVIWTDDINKINNYLAMKIVTTNKQWIVDKYGVYWQVMKSENEGNKLLSVLQSFMEFAKTFT